MATLSASRRNSTNSAPNTPRPSISGKMSSLSEESTDESTNDILIAESAACTIVDELSESKNENSLLIQEYCDNVGKNVVQTRTCSNRSDSGVSDCSSHLTSSSCNSTPLLEKKLLIIDSPNLINDIDTSPNFVSNTSIILSNTPVSKNLSYSFQNIDNDRSELNLSIEENKKGNGLDHTINTLTRRVAAKCKYFFFLSCS